jgi:hypothetical protein
MGAVDDGVPYLTYQHKPDPGFLSRRLEDAINGAFMAGVMHAPRIAGQVLGFNGQPQSSVGSDTKDLSVFGRDDVLADLQKKFNLNQDQLQTHASLIDSLAQSYSRIHDVPVEQAYAGMFARDMGQPLDGMVLYQPGDKLNEKPSKLGDLLTSDEFHQTFPDPNGIKTGDLFQWLNTKGVSQQDLAWNGLGQKFAPDQSVVKRADVHRALTEGGAELLSLDDEGAGQIFQSQAGEVIKLIEQARARLDKEQDPQKSQAIAAEVDNHRAALEGLYSQFFDPMQQNSFVIQMPKEMSAAGEGETQQPFRVKVGFSDQIDPSGTKALRIQDIGTTENKPLKGEALQLLAGRALLKGVDDGYDRVIFDRAETTDKRGFTDDQLAEIQDAIQKNSPRSDLSVVDVTDPDGTVQKQLSLSLTDLTRKDLSDVAFDLTGGPIKSKVDYDYDTLVKKTKEGTQFRAILDTRGDVWVMDTRTHERLQSAAGIPEKRVAVRGFATRLDDGFLFNASDTTHHQFQIHPDKFQYLPKETEREASAKERRQIFYQSDKGLVAFMQDGRAIIRAFEGADSSTLVHELAHIARRHVLVGEDLKTAEDWAGVKNGVWDEKNEEKFARGFERYIRDGQAPHSKLITIFDKLSTWLKGVYKVLAGSPINLKINDEMRGVFDRLLIEDSDPVTAKRMLIKDLTQRLSAYSNKAVKDLTPEEKINRDQMLSALGQARAELIRTQESQYTPNSQSPAALRAKEAEMLPTGAVLQNKENFKAITGAKWFLNQFKMSTAEISSFLKNYKIGRYLIEKLDNATVYRRTIVGEFNNGLKDVIGQLGTKNARWLVDHNELGYSNFRQLYDEVGSLGKVGNPNEQVRTLTDFLTRVIDGITDHSIQQAILRKLPTGDSVLMKRSTQNRLPRVLTQDAWEAIERGAGPMYTAMMEAVVRDNPGFKNNLEAASQAFQASYQRGTIRKFGTLEQSRAIKFMPDYVQVAGKWVGIFHVEPYHLLSHLIERQAARISFIREFGQNTLKNYATDKNGNPRKGLLQLLLKTADKAPRYTKDVLQKQLVEQGFDPAAVQQLNWRDLRKSNSALGLPTSPTHEELLGVVNSTSINEFKAGQVRKLRAIATKIGGVDSTAAPAELWNALRERATVAVEDDLAGRLRMLYGKEGGDTNHFDATLRVWQGLPYGWLNRNPLTRGLKFYSTVVGSAQTSLAVVKNIIQTPIEVPALGGIRNFAKAVETVYNDYDGARTRAVMTGAFQNIINGWAGETGYGLEQAGKNFAQAMSKVTGFAKVAEINNLLAAETGRQLADQWQKHGFRQKDIDTARMLLLNEKEIKGLLRREPMTAETYQKVVQNMVARTQGMTESPHRRSQFENTQIGRVLFAYSSYSFLETRALFAHLKALRDGITSGDPERMYFAGTRIATKLGAAIGVGLLSRMLIGAVKGQSPQPDDESWWKKVSGAAMEVQLLGSMNRVVEPFDFAGGSVERGLLGLFPQMSVITGLISMIGGYGKYGKFPITGRAEAEGLKVFPLANAIKNWTTKVSYPEYQGYEHVRALSNKFKQDVLGEPQFVGDTQINPDYYPVFQAIERGDIDQAIDAAQIYYQQQADLGLQSHRDALNKLRQSLVSRSPMFMSMKHMRQFVQSLPANEQDQVIAVQHKYMWMVNKVAPHFDF